MCTRLRVFENCTKMCGPSRTSQPRPKPNVSQATQKQGCWARDLRPFCSTAQHGYSAASRSPSDAWASGIASGKWEVAHKCLRNLLGGFGLNLNAALHHKIHSSSSGSLKMGNFTGQLPGCAGAVKSKLRPYRRKWFALVRWALRGCNLLCFMSHDLPLSCVRAA